MYKENEQGTLKTSEIGIGLLVISSVTLAAQNVIEQRLFVDDD
jgi:hypothetical protein